ncbi:hypothetical protein T492DRAFT_969399 [Pavlovales sp. CCMP2436]|nr:hypothetical protein T492DRAFT_969399 [Pavlovales sp. CCMP2436]|mmetsp:Transcript_1852/g.4788  ORF Transcript_1852/g.4788 Transcript_1852/m.4788 type:complete len:448 (-) Transcript_1852:246-1589(-)
MAEAGNGKRLRRFSLGIFSRRSSGMAPGAPDPLTEWRSAPEAPGVGTTPRMATQAARLHALVASLCSAEQVVERRELAHATADACAALEPEVLLAGIPPKALPVILTLLSSSDAPSVVFAGVIVANIAFSEEGQRLALSAGAFAPLMAIVRALGVPTAAAPDATVGERASRPSAVRRALLPRTSMRMPTPHRSGIAGSGSDEERDLALAKALAALQNLTYGNARACRLVARGGGRELLSAIVNHAREDVREYGAGILANVHVNVDASSATARAARWSSTGQSSAGNEQLSNIASILDLKMQNHAATNLQSAFRGHLGRRAALKQLAERRREKPPGPNVQQRLGQVVGAAPPLPRIELGKGWSGGSGKPPVRQQATPTHATVVQQSLPGTSSASASSPERVDSRHDSRANLPLDLSLVRPFHDSEELAEPEDDLPSKGVRVGIGSAGA